MPTLGQAGRQLSERLSQKAHTVGVIRSILAFARIIDQDRESTAIDGEASLIAGHVVGNTVFGLAGRVANDDGWAVEEIRPTRFETASFPGAPQFSPGGPRAWVATIRRTESSTAVPG